MDPRAFDDLSRTLAQSASRRQAVARFGTAGMLAGLVAALGRGRIGALAAAQGETCRLAIVATVRVGPDAETLMQTDVPGELRGEISFALDPDGAIAEGRFLLDGGPELPVVGQATGRALNLRADFAAIQEGLALVLVGTAQEPLSRCTGPLDGLLTGPLPGDLGDWHATAVTGTGSGTSAADANRVPTVAAPVATATPTPVPPRQESCLPGLTRCGGACVDVLSDVRNCGVCQLACSAGAACIGGSCICPPDRATSCNGVCVDLGSDRNNCGRCASVCESGLVAAECRGGACVRADCAVGLEYCGAVDLCRDLSSDPAHCGACARACMPGEFCSGGVCQPSVPIADIPLDEPPPDGLSPCLPGLVDCGNGICVNIFIDSFNCGGCGITCTPPAGCDGGVCVAGPALCADPLVDCGGFCADLGSDSFNCGGCGIVCSPQTPSCVAGTCTP